jgi:U3 small nucleolar RNA-associated protein 18
MAARPEFSSPLTSTHLGISQSRKKTKKQKHDPNQERNDAKRAKLEAEEAEEERLTSLLFGSGGGVGGAGLDDDDDDDAAPAWHDDDDDDDDSEEDDLHDGPLFQIDRTGEQVGSEEEDNDDEEEVEGEEADSDDEEDIQREKKTSAWVDDDDEKVKISLTKSDRTKKLRSFLEEDEVHGSTYEEKLRDRYEATTSAASRTDWATLPQSDHDSSRSDSDEDMDTFTASKLLSSTAPLLSNNRLQPNILNVVRCPDANAGHYNHSTVNAVQFHPGSDEDEPLMLTAGLDKTLRFFKINGTEGSEKVHGIHFPNFPIHCASFLGDTGSVVVSGRRSFFYIYDAVAGKVSLYIFI